MNTLKEVQEIWADNVETHKLIGETLYHKTNEIPVLKDFRDYIEANTFGHGERCFYWMWKLIIDEMPKEFRFLEIGIHKGQILALIRVLSDMADKEVYRYGVSPMDGATLNIESDFYADVEKLHDLFSIEKDYTIIEGLSTDQEIIKRSRDLMELDILYVDGAHDFSSVQSDLINYLPLVKIGGYAVIDDACNEMKLPEGYFGGIQSVTESVLAHPLPNDQFEFLFSVAHNKVFRRIK